MTGFTRGYKVLLSVFLVAIFIAPCQARNLTSIAVTDFDAQGSPAHEAAIIAERIRANLVTSGRFTVLERGQMEDILKEQGFQQSGACAEASCLIEIGQLLAVQRIVAGTVGKIGAMYTLTVKLIDVKTGEILLTRTRDSRGGIEEVLLAVVPQLSQQLAAEASALDLAAGYVSVESTPQGALVRLGEAELGTTPFRDIQVPTGTHTLTLTLDNYVAQEKTVTVGRGKRLVLDFTLSPTGEYREAQQALAVAKRGRIRRVVRWISTAVALAGAGATAYFYSDMNTKYNSYSSMDRPAASYPDLWSDFESAKTNTILCAALTGVGLIGLGVSFAF